VRFAEESEVHFWDAELQRLKGQLLARLSPGGGGERVETCYREALDIARRQQARSLELRAATSLGPFWRDNGKRDRARELLAPVYGWFTEGFDTSDRPGRCSTNCTDALEMHRCARCHLICWTGTFASFSNSSNVDEAISRRSAPQRASVRVGS
jgi:hypothetical protein